MLSPPGHPGGAASCPIPGTGSHLPWQGAPSWGSLFHSISLQAAEPGQQSLSCVWGNGQCLLVAPLLHTLVQLVLVLLGAGVALAVMAQGCPGVLGAGHSTGDSSTSRVQKRGLTTRAPNSREEEGAVQSCPTDTCILGSSQGKASAQQSTLCAGPGLTSPSPRAGQKQSVIPINSRDKEMEEGDSPTSPSSLPIHAPRDRAGTGTVPHSPEPLWLWLAALQPSSWHSSTAEHSTEGRSRSRGEFCERW